MKRILITGSTDGVGKLTATKLAKEGHEIIVHGRNAKKLENTISEIKQKTNNQRISGYVSDLSDFVSVKQMITDMTTDFSSIDVLINNAGVFMSGIDQNQNGLDLRFAVNYLAPYLLTYGLLPVLENSLSPRVINLSSAAQSTVSMEALEGTELISTNASYAQSKLALTMWSFRFAKLHPEIITIAVNPGSLLNTKMAQEAYGQHWSSADKGADILIELALSEKHANHTGTYFDNDKGAFSNAHNDVYSEEKVNQLLSITNKILNK
ncbi:SDR family NAD(P)-dependent oxidoreductase [Winogradskyella sediminis]|uniref:SDR family NAD(P)-dependent oxidoreductase n=1 Tax=Winogradskyella sediminis TaxID=1382466 RepID=UPI003AA8BB7F